MPSTIGWGAVALFLRHLPSDSEVMREMDPSARWSAETHMIANLADLVGGLFAKEYEPMKRPGETAKYSTAEPIDATGYEEKLAIFRKGAANG